MKKILTVLFAVALALSLTVFFAACGEKDENKGKENVITASLGKTEATVGEEVSVTYSATEGTVTVTYSKDGGAAVPSRAIRLPRRKREPMCSRSVRTVRRASRSRS